MSPRVLRVDGGPGEGALLGRLEIYRDAGRGTRDETAQSRPSSLSTRPLLISPRARAPALGWPAAAPGTHAPTPARGRRRSTSPARRRSAAPGAASRAGR